MEVNRKPKTLERRGELLLPIEMQALQDTYHIRPTEVLTPNEVLDIVVEYKGGLGSGYEVRSLISRVYGVEL